jgi:hypothetical protein
VLDNLLNNRRVIGYGRTLGERLVLGGTPAHVRTVWAHTETAWVSAGATDAARVVGQVLLLDGRVEDGWQQRVCVGGVWSAWERVDLDIEGDHLLPVIWNRRLHLFWAVSAALPTRPPGARTTAYPPAM